MSLDPYPFVSLVLTGIVVLRLVFVVYFLIPRSLFDSGSVTCFAQFPRCAVAKTCKFSPASAVRAVNFSWLSVVFIKYLFRHDDLMLCMSC